MKITVLIILIGGLGFMLAVGALGVLQAMRFRYLSGTSRLVSWVYLVITLIISIGILIVFRSIEW
ncbi:MAG: hypothetical protein UT55_C0046G0004 [Candidatus Peregrinibacteria bacterium GW2011_GWE2_39_6]|nr:MAG: hypothetical protein UT36_C0001G0100 [Candidatus Peregrinibacteria bacterium GW2011_GWF2_39_17]KKR25379.1 MAG: hypothetical protein UT55_C0046G0004 [Candidatus Peregrinibacteria bacterium GW2011_GWE2_39_6]HCW32441.1 hypothetical protein [Candidatus Peregrinibacteria bacterium]